MEFRKNVVVEFSEHIGHEDPDAMEKFRGGTTSETIELTRSTVPLVVWIQWHLRSFDSRPLQSLRLGTSVDFPATGANDLRIMVCHFG